MCPIDREQRELIFDYCMGLSGPSESARAEALIAQNARAAELQSSIQAALAPLSYLPAEYCPPDLADRTLRRLRERSGRDAARGRRSPTIVRLGRPDLSSAAGVVVTAACIVLIVTVLARSFGAVRQRYYRQRCGAHLNGIYRAASLYSSDYDGMLPAVAYAAGAAWHAIGSQDAGCCPNTRNPFLLLKLGYAGKPSDFLCCGKTGHDAPPLRRDELAGRSDFPSRDYITYSYRLMPPGLVKLAALGHGPLMADMNPHFERLTDGATRAVPLRLDEEMLRLNSPNHGGQGQNILFADGTVGYSHTRFIGAAGDDIYTMTDGDVGGGRQRPSDLRDIVLAP
ncbi:MAG: hypothetical protein JSW27_17965 [Phycisphaerales bacterium]|nr:MAG: hypothetical protein JSW27_17965 [Phycisphaerales bacterium]